MEKAVAEYLSKEDLNTTFSQQLHIGAVLLKRGDI